MAINVPWVKLPQTKYEQLRNGKRGVVFKLSPQYVGKIIYRQVRENKYELRHDKESLEELTHEHNICEKLYKNNIGNVPKPIGVDRLGILESSHPTFIMEYITLPRGDEINHVDLGKATRLTISEIGKATDIGLLAGKDVLNPANFFYDTVKKYHDDEEYPQDRNI